MDCLCFVLQQGINADRQEQAHMGNKSFAFCYERCYYFHNYTKGRFFYEAV